MSPEVAYFQVDLVLPPDHPVSGFARRAPNAPRLGPSRCRVRVVFLRTGGRSLAWVLGDFLYFPDHLAQNLRRWWRQTDGIDAFIFGGTHTHGGPELGFLRRHEPHLDVQEDLFRQLITALPKTPAWQPVRLDYLHHTFSPPLSAGRRVHVLGRALRLVNPRYPVHDLLNGLKITPHDGDPILIVSYASHPVFHRHPSASADYIGAVEDRLPNARLLLFPGFGGDVRPHYPARRRASVGALLRGGRFLKLVFGRDFRPYDRAAFDDFVHRLRAGLQRAHSKPLAPTLAVRTLEFDHSLRGTHPDDTKQLRTVLWSFGRTVWVGVAAEVFSAYADRLRRRFPHGRFICTGCLNHCVGYLPTPNALRYRGYETHEAPRWNGMHGPFDPKSVQGYEVLLYASVAQLLEGQ